MTKRLTAAVTVILIAVLVVTAMAAVMGGKAGEAYHRKVDRTSFDRS